MASDESTSDTPLSRVRHIEELLRTEGKISVRVLASDLGVSEVTVRRYLDQIVDRGLAKRSRGGAVARDMAFSDQLFTSRRSRQRDAKVRVGRQCADLIPQNSSLFIGGGTTTCEVAHFLSDRSDLTIFTSNLAAGSQFRSDGATVYVLGGRLRGMSCSLVGNFTHTAIKNLRADFAIIGADSISADVGVINENSEESAVAREMVTNSRLGVFCVVDASKWGGMSGHVTAKPEELKVLVTDTLPSTERQQFERIGVRVVTTDSQEPEYDADQSR